MGTLRYQWFTSNGFLCGLPDGGCDYSNSYGPGYVFARYCGSVLFVDLTMTFNVLDGFVVFRYFLVFTLIVRYVASTRVYGLRI